MERNRFQGLQLALALQNLLVALGQLFVFFVSQIAVVQHGGQFLDLAPQLGQCGIFTLGLNL